MIVHAQTVTLTHIILSVAHRKRPPEYLSINPPNPSHEVDISSIGTPVTTSLSKKARSPMLQMKLCGNSTDPSAPGRMDVAVADFIHSHLLPFSIASDAKMLKIIEIAKQLGQKYVVCVICYFNAFKSILCSQTTHELYPRAYL